ncbi:hypothetical protein V7138_01665 [Bacillus sp. JJ1533]|uniref:hypothetical protein n=1 Tax=Bacillus sp. JJ1533 TaxID=3122959 RepID=UPI002FFF41B8
MERIKLMFMHFSKEPLWFKILISITLLISIVFSSSFFSNNACFQSLSKLSAGIFFCALGINMRFNRKISTLFFTLAVICIILSIISII